MEQAYTATLEERFGFPAEIWKRWQFFQTNKKFLSFAPADHEIPVLPPAVASGGSFVKVQTRYPKLSTIAARVIGHLATRHYVDLDREGTQQYFSRQPVRLAIELVPAVTSEGYVLVRFLGTVVGVGFAQREDSSWFVTSMFPKKWALRTPNP